METSTRHGKNLRSTMGRIAMAIGLIFAIGGVGVGPAVAGGGGDHHDNGRHGRQGHEEHHDHGRYERPNYYNAPASDYYAPPNYYYAPPPPVYYQPQAPPSEGWNFIFPLGR